MRRRWPWALGIGLGLLLFAAWVVILVNPPEPRIEGIQAVGDRPFGEGTTLAGDVLGVAYSPDGTSLLVRTEEGLSLARNARLDPIGPRTPSIAAAAWFPNARLVLVAEGPARTGQLAVLDAQGVTQGRVELQPDVGFASGHGIAVLSGGKVAVAVTVDRDPLSGAELRTLTAIDLGSGVTTAIDVGGAPTGGVFASERGAVVSVERDGATCVIVVDPDGATEPPCLMRGRAVGAALGHAYGVRDGAVWTVPVRGGEPQELTGAVEVRGAVVAAVAPDGKSIVLRDPTGLRKREVPGPPA